MAIPADKLAAEQVEASRKSWIDHAARTTAVLAVLAAVSSGQYATQFSQTILAQAEASDSWSYYQAKSIKRHLVAGQAELVGVLAQVKPEASPALSALQQQNEAQTRKYDAELLQIKAQADQVEARKKRHEQQGFWYQIAFAVLQAGVVLSTIAASSKRIELWAAAIVCGVAGALLAANGYFLLLPRLHT
jgi:hypothetical protein